MKFKNEAIVSLFVLIGVLLFIVGMRCGLRDGDILAKDKTDTAVEAAIFPKQAKIEALEAELIAEREVEHVLYEYKPLPVGYESIGNIQPDETDAVLLAKTMWGEYRDSSNYNQCAAVCWCALNRVDAGFGDLKSVLTGGQYHGYSKNNPVDAELYAIALDVLARWKLEKFAVNGNAGRVLPSGYCWMEGDGHTNTYRNAYRGGEHITP